MVHAEEFNADGTRTGRYCGGGRAVLRVEGKSFVIKGGRCTSRRVGMGLLGGTRGMWLLLEDPNRTGRNDIIDGEIDLPGFVGLGSVTGTAIRAEGLNSATFSVWWGATKVTGTWTCGESGAPGRAP